MHVEHITFHILQRCFSFRKCSRSDCYRNTDKHQILADCSLRCSEYSATSAIVVSVHLLNGGSLSCQYSQRRNWSQSAAESWTWAPAALDRPAACTASASSLPWTGLQQTCSFLPNETRPGAGADRHRGRGSWWRGRGRVEGEFGQCFSALQSIIRLNCWGKAHTYLIKNLRSHKMLYATVWKRKKRTFQVRNTFPEIIKKNKNKNKQRFSDL